VVSRQIPASVAQRLLWMIQHYRPEFGALSCPLLCRIRGPMDADALVVALTALTGRHESLRTTFAGRGARLAQIVHDPVPLTLRRVDLMPAVGPDVDGSPDAESILGTAIRAELADPIDPQEWPARATLWRLTPTDHVLCLNLHHLVTDAWSTGILLRDVAVLYATAAGVDGADDLPPPGWQYADFADWQQRLLGGDELRRHQDYWRRQLTGAQLPGLGRALGGERAATDRIGAPAGVVRLDLDAATVTALRDLARTRHTTLFAVLLAGFYAHVSQVTGQSDLAVGSMFANRSRPELRETVGLLANMVLLRAQVPPDASFNDLIARTHSAVIGAFTYQDLPYQMLPMDVVPAQSIAAEQAVRTDDVMFQVMAAVEHRISAGAVDFELLLPEDIGSRFPFELTLAPIGADRVRAVLFHAAPWCSAATAEEFLSGYVNLLSVAAQNPDATLAS
jgi:Condensation domain